MQVPLKSNAVKLTLEKLPQGWVGSYRILEIERQS